MSNLKQSTETVITFGPFLDPADAVTPVTGLVTSLDHATTGISLAKAGAALAVRSQPVTATTYDADGNYLVTLKAADVGTLGRLRVQFSLPASTLPHWQDFNVLTAAAWNTLHATSGGNLPNAAADAAGGIPISDAGGLDIDAKLAETNQITAARMGALTDLIDGGRLDLLIDAILDRIPAALTGAGSIKASLQEWLEVAPLALASQRPQVDMRAINGVTDAAIRLALSAGTIVPGTAEAGTLSTTQMTTDLAEATDDHYNGRRLIWTTGALTDEATAISDYSGAGGLLTFVAVTEAPAPGDTFVIV